MVAIVATLAIGGAVFAHPPLAAYLLLGLTPLIAGVERGSLVPLLRPNEGLALLIGGAVVVRGLVRLKSGHPPSFASAPSMQRLPSSY